ncbi:MAG: integration host factor subunit beta [Candidatus Accumulibacter sp.]|uniref:Integration host factor subunit beta n=1 Tax=Candidatus Accumulibacter affinis TaxID=2954384 RepID=A0A935W712_9PROT|nr:integration host factor subunit beta [Candidatus Accumulibacter affinis]
MTRSELSIRLAAYPHFAQLTAKDAELSVKAILEGISEALARGDRIEIRGIGSFALNYRPPRNGRNPKTGETVPVPAKKVPHFTAGKELPVRLNHHPEKAAPSPLGDQGPKSSFPQSASSTLPYFASNGLRVAAARSMSWWASCSSSSAILTQTSSKVSGIWPNS